MTSKRNHERAADKKHLSLVLPIELFEKIETIKDMEQRNRNNLIVRMLTQGVSKYDAAKTKERKVAEDGPEYTVTNPKKKAA